MGETTLKPWSNSLQKQSHSKKCTVVSKDITSFECSTQHALTQLTHLCKA